MRTKAIVPLARLEPFDDVPGHWEPGLPVRRLALHRSAPLTVLVLCISKLITGRAVFIFLGFGTRRHDTDHSVLAAAVLVNLYVDDVMTLMCSFESRCSVSWPGVRL